MSDCQKCGGELDSDGLCMACLLEGGMATDGPTAFTVPAFSRSESPELSQDSFGPYSLLRPLGQGGMGVVYLAEQRHPIHRQVALKVIKLGMDTRAILARFMYERQALALMDHPNIARVFDASSTSQGRPFFVMEYIDGEPITTYCDRHRLNTRERLHLFIPVCQAVQHAHSKGVLHRDIKPSNVLVTEVDGAPVPKVIDFGIAKATEQSQNEQTAFTRFGQFIGTPEYMSPEAADPVHNDVDTTSDVYSLGVLLYELLAGAVPFDGRVLRKAGLDELLRIVREDEAPPLPAKLTELRDSDTLHAIAENRSTNPHGLRRELSGDLNSIVMKAVEKRRQRRYESVSDLWNDLQRHLDDRPILASPPSRAYRFRKFVRRNRAAVFSTAAITLALLIGVTAALWQARRATRERELAVAARVEAENERRRAQAQAARAALQESLAKHNLADVDRLANLMLFELDDKVKDLGGSTEARKSLVALGLQYLQKARSDNPQLGAAYFRLAELQGVDSLLDLDAAKTSYRLAIPLLEVRAAAHPPDSESRRLLALALWRLSALEDAEWRQEAGLRRAESVAASLLAAEPRNTAAMHALANIWIDAKQPARAIEIENRATAAGTSSPDDRAMLAKAQLAMADWSSANAGNAAALQWASRAVDTMEKTFAENPGNARYRIQLSACLSRLTFYQRAANQAPAARLSANRAHSLAVAAAEADRQNPRAQAELANSETTLSLLTYSAGDMTQTRRHVSAANTIRRGLMQKYPAVLSLALDFSSWTLEASTSESENSNFPEALAMLRESESILRRAIRAHPESRRAKRLLHRTLTSLADSLRSTGSQPAARAAFLEAIQGERALAGAIPTVEDADALASALQSYALALTRFGESGEAIRQYSLAASALRRAGVREGPFTEPLQRLTRINYSLADLHLARNDLPAMRACLDELFPIIDKWATRNPADANAFYRKWDYLDRYRIHAERTGQPDRAIALAKDGLNLSRRHFELDPANYDHLGVVVASFGNLTFDLQRAGLRQQSLQQTQESLAFIETIRFDDINTNFARLDILRTYSYFTRLLAIDFNESQLAIPHATRIAGHLEAMVKANPSNNQAISLLQTVYRYVSTAYLNASRTSDAIAVRRKELNLFLLRPPQSPSALRTLADHQLVIGNYEDRLGNPVAAAEWRRNALASLAKSIQTAESRLAQPGAAVPALLGDLHQSHLLSATVHEYMENWAGARADTESALSCITRLASLLPQVPANHSQLSDTRARLVRIYTRLHLPEDAFRLPFAGRLPSPEERQIEEAAGLRLSATNMFSTGYHIEPRITFLDTAVALVRALPASPARNIELAKSLQILASALIARTRFTPKPLSAPHLSRARQSLLECREILETLQSAGQLPSTFLPQLQAVISQIPNLDAQLPATQSTNSPQR